MSETVILWIIGAQTTLLLTLLGLLARALGSHLEACRRWQQQFLVEHGGMQASQNDILRRLAALESRK